MPYKFLDIARTPEVEAAEQRNGTAAFFANFKGNRQFDRFTEDEIGFIASRDSFYMATVSSTGWPYIQHRGGPAGFLKVLDDRTLGFADFRGNLQYISIGNLAGSDKAALFLMDYPQKTRLKMFVHAEERDLANDPKLAEALSLPGYKAKVERALIFHLEAFDWNCPQHITPRFTEEELRPSLEALHARMEALEAENQKLKEALASRPSTA